MAEAIQKTEENGVVLTERGLRLLFTMFRSMFSRPRSLRSKLAHWNAVVLLLTLLLLEVIVYQAVTYAMVSDLDARLQTQESKLEAATRQWQSSGTVADLVFFHQLAQSEPINEFSTNPISIKVFDKQTGHILALSPLLNRVLLPFNHSDFEAALHGQHILSVLQDASGNQVQALTFPLFDKIQRLVAIAQVSQSLQVVKQVQAILVNVLSIGGLIAVIVAYMASFLVTNRALRPLSRLISTMHRLSAQDMQIRFYPRILTTEVIQLSEAFNQMLDRLEASFALQRTFVADVSHELRTPLTAIQGHLDVLLLDPELDGIRPDLKQISAEVRRLSHLVANLLTTARAEAGVLPQPFANGVQLVQLDLLLVEVAREAHFLNQQGKLEVGHLEQICVPGDADLLKQLLLNLVDNALRYTPPTGRVTLELTRSDESANPPQQQVQTGWDKWAILSVCDTGPGIAPEDLPHIFERHYRARHSRIASGKPGSGLGLSIARLIAQAHNGFIDVKSGLGKGTRFSVWLPSAKEVTTLIDF